jgi:methylated-DNA-[protein]-cysteine S-methyltransferase
MTTRMNTRPEPLSAQATVPSPLGSLLLAATAHGLAGCWFVDQRYHPGELDAPYSPGNSFIAQAVRELNAYWQDALTARFRVALDLQGTPFQQAVWRMLLGITPGASTSYGAMARELGRPQAVRAVGGAVGRNRLSIIIPCHRALGHDGTLTGYAGGLPRKIELLRREGRASASVAPRRSTRIAPVQVAKEALLA